MEKKQKNRRRKQWKQERTRLRKNQKAKQGNEKEKQGKVSARLGWMKKREKKGVWGFRWGTKRVEGREVRELGRMDEGASATRKRGLKIWEEKQRSKTTKNRERNVHLKSWPEPPPFKAVATAPNLPSPSVKISPKQEHCKFLSLQRIFSACLVFDMGFLWFHLGAIFLLIDLICLNTHAAYVNWIECFGCW